MDLELAIRAAVAEVEHDGEQRWIVPAGRGQYIACFAPPPDGWCLHVHRHGLTSVQRRGGGSASPAPLPYEAVELLP